MRVHRRRLTIEIEQLTLRVERGAPESPVEPSPNCAVADLAHPRSERGNTADDAFRVPLMPPKEIA